MSVTPIRINQRRVWGIIDKTEFETITLFVYTKEEAKKFADEGWKVAQYGYDKIMKASDFDNRS